MPSPVVEILSRVGAALEPLGIRWYLFGAQAAILHGAARLTADVDVTVDAGDRPTADLVRALDRQGLELRGSNAGGFVERTRVLPLVHADSRIPLDVVLAGPGLEDLFFQRAEVRVVEGVHIPVVAPDDLVAMKVLAGRPKDIEDAVAVLRAQGAALDVGRARETLELLEQALDRRDLLPVLEQAIEQARSRGSS